MFCIIASPLQWLYITVEAEGHPYNTPVARRCRVMNDTLRKVPLSHTWMMALFALSQEPASSPRVTS
jgi:hypothetical protein